MEYSELVDLQKRHSELDLVECNTQGEAELICSKYDALFEALIAFIEIIVRTNPCTESINTAIIQLAKWSGCADDIEKCEHIFSKLLRAKLITKEQSELYQENQSRRQG